MLNKTNVEHIYTIKVKDFLNKTKTPTIQRDHKARVESGKVNYFQDMLPNHLVVNLALYIGKDFTTDNGHTIQRGDYLVVDGNTRKFFWQVMMESKDPKWLAFNESQIVCGYREFSEIEDLNKWYATFDSKEQIKVAKHKMESAASLIGIDSERVAKLSSALNKCSSKVADVCRKYDVTEEEAKARQIEAFGTHYINEFYDNFEKLWSPKQKSSIGPFLVAYRYLLSSGQPRSVVNSLFTEMFTGHFDRAMNEAGDKCVALELRDMFLTDGIYSYLNPKGAGDRIEIISAVVYKLIQTSIESGKYFVSRKRKPFAQSQEGAKRAIQIFNEELRITV